MPPFPLNVLDSDPPNSSELDTNQHARKIASLINGEVRFHHHDRMLYATDASIYQIEPLGIVIPQNHDDVLCVIEYARDNNLPLLPRGAGTSLAGQAVNHAIILDFSVYCNRFLSLDNDKRECTVEPGIILDHLNEIIAKRTNSQLMFAPDVATSNRANIGGMIGNNSAGAHSIRFGRTVRHVKQIKAALADGTVLDFHEGAAQSNQRINHLTTKIEKIIRPIANLIKQNYPDLIRSEGGYNLGILLNQFQSSAPTDTFDRVNLAQLLVGSEGTLAVTLEATLNLVPRPAKSALAILAFPSLDQAVSSVASIIETNPSAVELLDNIILDLARKNLQTRHSLADLIPTLDQPNQNEPPAAVLYVQYTGQNDDEINSQLQQLKQKRKLPDQSAAINIHTSPDEIENAWQLRKAAEPLVHAIPGCRKPIGFVEDTAVSPDLLPEFVRRFRAIVGKHNTTASYYAHASVGCLHIRPLLNLRDPLDRAAMQTIAREVADLVREFHGSFSAEHGFGRARGALLPTRFPPPVIDAITKIKHLFDPQNRLNPDNLINPQPITEHLRIQPDNSTLNVPEVDTFFNYNENADNNRTDANDNNKNNSSFANAVELCNGAAVCRKQSTGIMCPSYMALHDERHSTRGRANALRLAVTGQLAQTRNYSHGKHTNAASPQWNDPETLATLDLCLSCKGCKSECPSNVDLARYKSEYLAQSFKQRRRIPLRTHLFSRIDKLNAIASTLAPLTNTLTAMRLTRAIINNLLAIDPRRSLPTFVNSFRDSFRPSLQPVAPAINGSIENPTVILYADCFTNFNEPHIARAAVRVLNAFGYRVFAPKIPCCARAAISQGHLPLAQKQITRAANALQNAVQQSNAVAVMVCEPSCLASIRDDWLDLKSGTSAQTLQNLAQIARLPEEFIEENWNHHPTHPEIKLSESSSPKRILFHAHCHQKSLWGIDSTINLLNRITNGNHDNETSIEPLDTTCCGMAGAFGYHKNHYDLSIQIGELTLFPAVRTLHPSDLILTTGTSCRHQIRDATDHSPLHPIEFIAQNLPAQ